MRKWIVMAFVLGALAAQAVQPLRKNDQEWIKATDQYVQALLKHRSERPGLVSVSVLQGYTTILLAAERCSSQSRAKHLKKTATRMLAEWGFELEADGVPVWVGDRKSLTVSEGVAILPMFLSRNRGPHGSPGRQPGGPVQLTGRRSPRSGQILGGFAPFVDSRDAASQPARTAGRGRAHSPDLWRRSCYNSHLQRVPNCGAQRWRRGFDVSRRRRNPPPGGG